MFVATTQIFRALAVRAISGYTVANLTVSPRSLQIYVSWRSRSPGRCRRDYRPLRWHEFDDIPPK